MHVTPRARTLAHSCAHVCAPIAVEDVDPLVAQLLPVHVRRAKVLRLSARLAQLQNSVDLLLAHRLADVVATTLAIGFRTTVAAAPRRLVATTAVAAATASNHNCDAAAATASPAAACASSTALAASLSAGRHVCSVVDDLARIAAAVAPPARSLPPPTKAKGARAPVLCGPRVVLVTHL